MRPGTGGGEVVGQLAPAWSSKLTVAFLLSLPPHVEPVYSLFILLISAPLLLGVIPAATKKTQKKKKKKKQPKK